MPLPALGTLSTTRSKFYTVTSRKPSTVTNIYLVNEDASPRTFTVYLSLADNSFKPISPKNKTIEANGMASLDTYLVMTTGTSIEAISDGTDVSIVIIGNES